MLSLRNFSMTLALAATTALGGCVVTSETSDEPTGSGPSYPHPSEAAFCAALAAAQCTDQTVKACYLSDDATLAEDRASCVAKRKVGTTCRESVTGTLASGAQYNPAQDTEGCIAAHTTIYADASLTNTEIETAIKTCVKIFSGSSGANASCTQDYDCDTTADLRCILKPGQTTGTCAVPTEVGGGQNCMAPAAVCAETFYCDAAEGASGACLEAPAQDGVCTAEKPCQPDFNCTAIDMEGVGVCDAKLSNGEGCLAAKPGECKGGFCNVASGQTEGKCASTLLLAQTSTSCDAF
jgi:hypothetical protein